MTERLPSGGSVALVLSADVSLCVVRGKPVCGVVVHFLRTKTKQLDRKLNIIYDHCKNHACKGLRKDWIVMSLNLIGDASNCSKEKKVVTN